MSISSAKCLLFLVAACVPATNLLAGSQPAYFEAMDGGTLSFTSATSANLTGTGITNEGGVVISAGAVNITGPAKGCTNGFSAETHGAFTYTNGDKLTYTLHQQLCPTSQPNIYIGTGSFTITGGTGMYQHANGGGIFNGLGDFTNPGKYQCVLNGVIF